MRASGLHAGVSFPDSLKAELHAFAESVLRSLGFNTPQLAALNVDVGSLSFLKNRFAPAPSYQN